MLTTLPKEIDGLKFEIVQLPLKDARAVLVRLTRTIGPVLTQFMGKKLGDVDSSAALGFLMTALREEDLEFICEKFGGASKVQVGPHMVPVSAGEAVFQGRMLTMFKWLWACAEHNYGDLFLGLAALNPPNSTPTPAP